MFILHCENDHNTVSVTFSKLIISTQLLSQSIEIISCGWLETLLLTMGEKKKINSLFGR